MIVKTETKNFEIKTDGNGNLKISRKDIFDKYLKAGTHQSVSNALWITPYYKNIESANEKEWFEAIDKIAIELARETRSRVVVLDAKRIYHSLVKDLGYNHIRHNNFEKRL